MNSLSEEEAEFDIVINAADVKPYLYEPLAKPQNASSSLNSTESGSNSEDEDVHRVGNIDW